MLNVVGGIYRENCTEPEWKQLFGSGLRAAASLQSTGVDTHLHSYVACDEVSLAETTAQNTFGITFHPAQRQSSITFYYEHGLSTPVVTPGLHILKQESPLAVDHDSVLRFGFLEGTAIVRGKMVVYDPQSAYSPAAFNANGSAAERLAIVCNRREAFLLTGQRQLVAAIHELHKTASAEVVVVKCGADGAYVSFQGTVTPISARKTNRVWPIGSGDVFAAWFAYAWMSERLPPIESADLASKAAAYYCSHRALPVIAPMDLRANFSPPLVSSQLRAGVRSPPSVYLAGPFFTMMQRWLINEGRSALLDSGLNVFSPYHDVGFGSASEVVPADIKALDASDAVFAILEGLDSGTLFEIGYARAKNIPVICFAQNVSDDSVKMLVGTGCELFDDFVTAIYQTTWSLRA